MALKYKDNNGIHDVSKVVYNTNEVGDLKYGDTWVWAKKTDLGFDCRGRWQDYNYGYKVHSTHEPTFQTDIEYDKVNYCYYGCEITPYATTEHSWNDGKADLQYLNISNLGRTGLQLGNPNDYAVNYTIKASFKDQDYDDLEVNGTIDANSLITVPNVSGYYVYGQVTMSATREGYYQHPISFEKRTINTWTTTITIDPEVDDTSVFMSKSSNYQKLIAQWTSEKENCTLLYDSLQNHAHLDTTNYLPVIEARPDAQFEFGSPVNKVYGRAVRISYGWGSRPLSSSITWSRRRASYKLTSDGTFEFVEGTITSSSGVSLRIPDFDLAVTYVTDHEELSVKRSFSLLPESTFIYITDVEHDQ